KEEDIHFVGNTMIDTLVAFDSEIRNSSILEEIDIDNDFILVTLHRPSNVDSYAGLLRIVLLLERVGAEFDVVFPIHPRTRNSFETSGLMERLEAVGRMKLL